MHQVSPCRAFHHIVFRVELISAVATGLDSTEELHFVVVSDTPELIGFASSTVMLVETSSAYAVQDFVGN